MVGSLALSDQASIAFDGLAGGFLDLPFTDIAKCLSANGGFLGSLGGRPARCPIAGELLKEGGFDRGRLQGKYVSDRAANNVIMSVTLP